MLLVLLAVVVLGLLGRWIFGGDCHSGVVNVAGRGQLTNLHVEGNRLFMFIKNTDNTGLQVVAVDTCTGREKSALTIKTH